MYTILLDNDNCFTTSMKERIMERSKLVDSFHILVEPTYNEFNMSEFTCVLKYILPISKKYKTEILTFSEELYKDKLELKLPFDTALTSEPGDINFTLSFTKVDIDPDGNGKQYVRTTDECPITIIPIAKWDDIIPDEALNAVEQKLIALDTKINKLNDMADVYNKTKADNIAFNGDGDVQLKSMGEFIGDSVVVATPGTIDDDNDPHDGIIDLDYIYDTVTI